MQCLYQPYRRICDRVFQRELQIELRAAKKLERRLAGQIARLQAGLAPRPISAPTRLRP